MAPRFASLSAFTTWLEQAPPTTALQAADVREVLGHFTASSTPVQASPTPNAEQAGATWRERLWLVPADTRLGVVEAAEALGRPRSFVHRHTSEKACSAGDRLPHRKLAGELQFIAGELRQWITEHEETIVAGRIATPTLSLNRRAS